MRAGTLYGKILGGTVLFLVLVRANRAEMIPPLLNRR